MSLAIVHSRAVSGMHAPPVTVEVHISRGMPRVSMVGLPETAVQESRDRVRSALINSGFEFPARRITINLAPADLPKEGGRFDLPVAIGILAASGQLPRKGLAGFEFAGELALSGALRSVRGVLPVAVAVANAGRSLMIPRITISDRGWQTLSDMPAAFADEIRHMKNHSFSAPIRTGNGFHILHLTGIRQPGGDNETLSTAEIRKKLLEQKYESGVNKWLSLLKSRATINMNPDS